MISAAEGELARAVAEMPMRIRRAYKDWQNAPEQIAARGVRIEVGVADCDPFRWLLAQRFPRQVLWSSRGGDEMLAGLGCCHEITGGAADQASTVFARGREVLAHFSGSVPRYLGGFAFSERSVEEAPWQEMGTSRFWIPFAELVRSGGRCVLACNLYFQRNVEDSLTRLLHDWEAVSPALPAPEALPTLMCRRDHPDKAGWESRVRAALDLIESGVLDKLVLARKAEYTFASPVSAIQILSVLRGVTDNCYHFLLQPSARAAFMGTPPECLYRRRGRDLQTEALAGTRPRVSDPEEDAVLAAELLASPKERLEQEIVRLDLIRQLHLLADTLEAEETPRLLRLERKQHLISRLTATLRPGVDDADILAALHPTPAVGGAPRANALRELARLEPFRRGWYAAPVGVFGADDAEFAVAIRSGLVCERQVNVYSGAGIVRGSDPAAEWQEIENKISDFVTVTRGRFL